jgi:hypothetical protein
MADLRNLYMAEAAKDANFEAYDSMGRSVQKIFG